METSGLVKKIDASHAKQQRGQVTFHKRNNLWFVTKKKTIGTLLYYNVNIELSVYPMNQTPFLHKQICKNVVMYLNL